jgi:dipeptidyl aminopeptidase/acylaminoacyl peptidase
VTSYFLWPCILLAIVVGIACSPPVGLPNWPSPAGGFGLNGRLLYTDRGLWTVDLATGQRRQLVQPPDTGQVTSARWSPDGGSIAYAVSLLRERRTPFAQIHIVSADGSQSELLLESEDGTRVDNPVWAPNSSHVYFSRVGLVGSGRLNQIERVDIATGRSQTVHAPAGSFDISSDGRQLILARPGERGMLLALIDLATGDERVLVPDRRFDSITSPRVEPTSTDVLFGGAIPEAAEGLEPSARLVRVGAPWSYVARAHGPPHHLFRITTTGEATPSRFSALPTDEPSLAPSPDGTDVAVYSPEGLATVPLAGGRPQLLVTPGAYGAVDWTR